MLNSFFRFIRISAYASFKILLLMEIVFIIACWIICSCFFDLFLKTIHLMFMLRFFSLSLLTVQTRKRRRKIPEEIDSSTNSNSPMQNEVIVRINERSIVHHALTKTIVFMIDYFQFVFSHLKRSTKDLDVLVSLMSLTDFCRNRCVQWARAGGAERSNNPWIFFN